MQRSGGLEVYASAVEVSAALSWLAEIEPLGFLTYVGPGGSYMRVALPPAFEAGPEARFFSVLVGSAGMPEVSAAKSEDSLVDAYDIVTVQWFVADVRVWEPFWISFRAQSDEHDPTIMVRRFKLLKKRLLKGATRGIYDLSRREVVKHVYVSPGAREHYAAGGMLEYCDMLARPMTAQDVAGYKT